MEFTRRFWGVTALGFFLGGFAVLLDRPIVLVGVVALAGWLLARSLVFVRRVTHLDDSLSVEQSLASGHAAVDDPVHGVLAATIDEPTALHVTIDGGLPASLRVVDDSASIELPAGARSAEAAFRVEPAVAGAFRFRAASVHVTDPSGLFEETFLRGSEPSLVVEAPSPHDLHVGTGGERITVTYGDHPGGALGTGLEPAEIREYVPGDAAKRIDWKATARLVTPHVREFESETDREFVMLFDHGPSTGTGRAGRTELDYLREVALGMLNAARTFDDPVALYTIDGAELSGIAPPRATSDAYESIRLRLHDLETTPPIESLDSMTPVVSPATAHRFGSALGPDDDPLARTLRPFFRASGAYVRRLENKPLFDAARTAINRHHGSTWIVIFTDDSDRAAVRETTRLVGRRGNHAMVFLAPSLLYDPNRTTDLESAYQQYLAFEEFRRDLTQMPNVDAFEVGPGDRLNAILSDRKRGRTRPRRS